MFFFSNLVLAEHSWIYILALYLQIFFQATSLYYTSGDTKANKTNSQEYHTKPAAAAGLWTKDAVHKDLRSVSPYTTAEPTPCSTLQV